MLTFLLFVVFIACVGWLSLEGMWSNAIRLVNVVTAALLATNYFEPAADWLEGHLESYTYACDFLALWGLFVIFMVALRVLTDVASRVKVRFLQLADRIGGVFFAAWIGWVMVCFTAFSLHTAPLARNPLRGSFVPEQRAQGSLAPDLLWLGFVQRVSRGQFSRTLAKEDLREFGDHAKPYLKEDGTRTFDAAGEFIPKYTTRRENLEKYNNKNQAIRVREVRQHKMRRKR